MFQLKTNFSTEHSRPVSLLLLKFYCHFAYTTHHSRQVWKHFSLIPKAIHFPHSPSAWYISQINVAASLHSGARIEKAKDARLYAPLQWFRKCSAEQEKCSAAGMRRRFSRQTDGVRAACENFPRGNKYSERIVFAKTFLALKQLQIHNYRLRTCRQWLKISAKIYLGWKVWANYNFWANVRFFPRAPEQVSKWFLCLCV